MAENVKIKSTDSNVDFTQNSTGTFDTILNFEVPSPFEYRLVNGKALRVDLEDSGGSDLEDTSEVLLAWQPPTDETVRKVDKKDLRTYNGLSFSEQRDDDFSDQVSYEVEQGVLKIPTDYNILVQLDSPTQIDTSNSYVELEVQRERTSSL